MRIAAAVLCGFFMDLCLGDPDWMPHPVIYMGKAISALEKFLRRRFPDTQKGLLMAGAALAAILPLGSFLMAAAAIYLAGLVHPVLAFLLETLWCWQALAVKGLYTESMRVKKKLEEQDLPGARSPAGALRSAPGAPPFRGRHPSSAPRARRPTPFSGRAPRTVHSKSIA